MKNHGPFCAPSKFAPEGCRAPVMAGQQGAEVKVPQTFEGYVVRVMVHANRSLVCAAWTLRNWARGLLIQGPACHGGPP